MMLPTTQCDSSSAQICRDRGWEVGNWIEGDTPPGKRVDIRGLYAARSRLEITAIGHRQVLAKAVGMWIAHTASDDPPVFESLETDESIWDLHGRDWERV